MVFIGAQRHAHVRQRAAHHRVAGQGLGLVVVVGEHGLRMQCLGQRRDRFAGHGVQCDQAGRGLQSAQRGIQLNHRSLDELDPPVGARQGVEDLLVEDKDAVHLPAGLERVVERRMVKAAQVTPEPGDAGSKFEGSAGAVFAQHSQLLHTHMQAERAYSRTPQNWLRQAAGVAPCKGVGGKRLRWSLGVCESFSIPRC